MVALNGHINGPRTTCLQNIITTKWEVTNSIIITLEQTASENKNNYQKLKRENKNKHDRLDLEMKRDSTRREAKF